MNDVHGVTAARTGFSPDPATELDAVVSEARSDRRALIAAIALALFLGLFLQGARPLFEPDEGVYAAAGRMMAESGEWLIPQLNGGPFLDKPPLISWGIAAGDGGLRSQCLRRSLHARTVVRGNRRPGGPDLGRGLGTRSRDPRDRGLQHHARSVHRVGHSHPDTLLAFWSTALLYAYWG